MKDVYITVSQAGEYLGLEKDEIKELVKQGKLIPYYQCLKINGLSCQ